MLIKAESFVKLGIFPSSFLSANINSLNAGFDFGVPCLFYGCTGIKCWGCGMTHAINCIWHGEVVESLAYHKLGWLVFIIMIYIFIKEAWRLRMRTLF